MPKIASEGNVKVYWLPTVANKAAPTVANITAGTELTAYLPTSGVGIDWTQNNASLDMLDESFTAEVIGTEGATITLTFVRDDTDDDAWDLFVRGTNGYLLVSRFGTPAATDVVEVYPVQSHRPVPLPPATNEFQQARVMLAVHDAPELNAVVAA
jgi:hypothetical protein